MHHLEHILEGLDLLERHLNLTVGHLLLDIVFFVLVKGFLDDFHVRVLGHQFQVLVV